MFGISRQAWHKRQKRVFLEKQQEETIIQLIREPRKIMPRLGGKKVYRKIKPELQQLPIKMGRDKLFTFMREHKLLVKRKKNFTKTTNSMHRFRKHPNLIKGLEIVRPEQVWVSDITYIRTREGFMFLCLITDAYSKLIMGHYLADNLKTEGPVIALKMALAKRKYPEQKLIHHSDRGFQYCSDEYTNLLSDNQIDISMTQSYDPYENAIAERVNGILKDEFELGEGLADQKNATREINHSVRIYNTERPHLSCNFLTPAMAHKQSGLLKKLWKKRTFIKKEVLMLS